MIAAAVIDMAVVLHARAVGWDQVGGDQVAWDYVDEELVGSSRLTFVVNKSRAGCRAAVTC